MWLTLSLVSLKQHLPGLGGCEDRTWARIREKKVVFPVEVAKIRSVFS